MTSIDPAYTEYLEQMFAYEEEAYQAAENGDYGKAIETWSTILGDEQRRSCFDDETQQEMAFNLAAAYYLNGDDEAFERVIGDWSLSNDDRQKIVDSVETE